MSQDDTAPRRDLRVTDRAVDRPRRRVMRAAFFTLAVSQWMAACGGNGSDATAEATPAPPAGPTPPSPPTSPSPPSSTPAPTPAPPPAPTFAPTPAPPAGSLPDWVPAAGQVRVLTRSSGLTNNFRDTCPVYYDAENSVKVVNDFSTSFKNPYWGFYGGQVFFGGGHAGTNNNMVVVAEYGQTAITFKRVCDPTPWFGSTAAFQTQNSTGDANSKLNRTYYDSTIDGKPGSPHSYASGDIIGPEHGGAASGTYIQVIAAAVNHANDGGAVAAHKIDFNDITSSPSARNWQRVTNITADEASFGDWPAPLYTAFVPPQNRIYITPNGPNVQGLVRWFDLSTRTWIRGNGTGFSNGESDGFDSGIKFFVPSRNLLVFIYPLNAQLKVQWMDVSVAQPTLGGTATLSQTLRVGSSAASTNWSAACWCPLTSRIIVAGVFAGGAMDNTAVYEIAIPSVLSTTWPVDRAPLGAGQTLVPPDTQLDRGVTWKKFFYDEKVRSIVYFPLASPDGDDTVYVYRPRFT
ncbi:MAG: hypothetical protein JNN03_03540 [Rubrivivax sp.]|nr:hypothetical protein [Rubrivivax sp.]